MCVCVCVCACTNRIKPVKGAPFSLIAPSGVSMLINSKLFLFPHP